MELKRQMIDARGYSFQPTQIRTIEKNRARLVSFPVPTTGRTERVENIKKIPVNGERLQETETAFQQLGNVEVMVPTDSERSGNVVNRPVMQKIGGES